MVQEKKITGKVAKSSAVVPAKSGSVMTVKKKFVKKETNDDKVKRSLRASTTEGCFNAASGSITSTFITPLALALKATNAEIGVLSAVQDLAHTVAQVPGAKLTGYYSRKSIWLLSQTTSKILLWIPIILLPFLPINNPVTLLIALMFFVAFFSGLRAPAWSSLMGDLVPLKTRGRYFGMRNMITGLAGLATTIVSGLLVTYYGFSVIFIGAILFSIVSIFFFMRMYEPTFKRVFHYRHEFNFNPKHWSTSLSVNKALVIFTVYLFFMNFAVEIAAPFYTVYMLKDMNIGYLWFAIITTFAAAVRIFSFKYWGRISDRFGSRKILIVTGFFACFTPFMWLFVSNPYEIIILKVLDGFVWAGMDLVVFNYLLDVTPANKRPQYVANHNFFAGMGVVLGALTGGFLAELLQSSTFLWFYGLQIVFLVSFILRLGTLCILPKIREIDIKYSEIVPIRYVFMQSMAVEPAHGVKNTLFFTFRYPEKVRHDLENSVKTLRYKIRMKKN
ncbi:MAG TPA: MFS transporter [archaeon]|nr:MFS transporter [archaeon]